MLKTLTRLGAALACVSVPLFGAGVKPKPADVGARVSYYNDLRPIFVAECQGCHQPSKISGGYLMTEFKALLAGGMSKKPAVVPGVTTKSNLLTLITPVKGVATMPMNKPPLSVSDIDVIARWIAQGAKDDSAEYAKARFDEKNPPAYTRPPVITSLDYAPDGSTMAVTGFNEVLLVDATDGKLVARLIGKSERIQSLKFSPDGKRLAAVGGLPGRSGEVQIWEVGARKLMLSQSLTADTLYGVSWSPDGTRVAFGCADNVVRALDASDGKQTLFMGSHSDWPLSTVWSVDGSQLVSVGRDMTVKLTEVATQRFIDNVTSITPGALKGGIQTVARHPSRDEIVMGGADGAPKVYRMNRLVTRVIGDDSNLIKQFPPMKGRVFGVAVSKSGKRIAAVSSLDGKGEVAVYGYEFDTSLPDRIKAIMAKVSTSRSAAEAAELEKYHTENVAQIANLTVDESSLYCVAFAPDDRMVAAAGADGTIRIIDTETGKVEKTFAPAPVTPPTRVMPSVSLSAAAATRPARHARSSAAPSTKANAPKVVALEAQPRVIQLAHKFDTTQLVVSARLASGNVIDVTQRVTPALSAKVVALSDKGFVTAVADGAATLKLSLGDRSVSLPVVVKGTKAEYKADFARDVNPILSRLGCNAGTCHGSAQGKQGFKLSLRGYDPIEDVRALTDDLDQRRVNVASPDDSLMLLKATGAVPHVGARLFHKGDAYYEIVRNWIAHGARLDPSAPRVARIEVAPQNPVVQKVGERQQMRVVATYTDGITCDVTREAYIESGNTEVATSDRDGRITAARRGEAAVLARYEGAYAATTVTVMGDRTGFAWKQPPLNNRVDELVALKWKRMKIQPSELCTDAEFIRRAHLDLTGLPPTSDAVRAFLADPRDTKVKRDDLVDKLVGNREFVDHWTNKWADLLQVNRKFLEVEGAAAFRKWIRNEVEQNTPYDQLAKKILMAKGSNRENPAASYYKILREAPAIMENTTHLFLGVRFNCNKCHDHPFERWTQDQYYQMSAFFVQTALKTDPASGQRRIGGTAVEGSKPLYEEVYDSSQGDMTHLRTGAVAPPKFPFDCNFAPPTEKPTRREQLSAWLTSKDNPYFARSYVNRLWGYLFGIGIIEPIDDLRAGNPATNPELLNYLTQEFIGSGFNARHMLKLIARSRTYQLAVATNRWNEDDTINYSHAIARRLPAEVLYDVVHAVTGTPSKFPGLPPGTRAAELPDSGVELPSGFLATFGRPVRESACECERTSGLQLGPVMALATGPVIAEAIHDPRSELPRLIAKEPDDAKVINELFLRILNRPATEKEIRAVLEAIGRLDQDHAKLVASRDAREKEWADKLPKLEQQREDSIAKATSELDAHKVELEPKLVEREKERQLKIAQTEAELKNYEGPRLATKVAELRQRGGSAEWTKLDPKTVRATSLQPNQQPPILTRQADLSIVASGPNPKSVYTVVVETDLSGGSVGNAIAAIRLEAIADPKFPAGGPGRAGDGNVVLTEFEVSAAPKNDPAAAKKLALRNARADFSQENFPVQNAIDGNNDGGSGWALSPTTGVTHWATFELTEPVSFAGGAVLTFTLRHNFNGNQYQLGRFRLSATTTPQPGVSIAEEYATLVTAALRTPQQDAALRNYFSRTDNEWRGKFAAVAEAKRPLAKDSRLQELEDNLALFQKPVQLDPVLAQLRADVETSARQLQNKRLTAMQDLTWALINTPAFLFNR